MNQIVVTAQVERIITVGDKVRVGGQLFTFDTLHRPGEVDAVGHGDKGMFVRIKFAGGVVILHGAVNIAKSIIPFIPKPQEEKPLTVKEMMNRGIVGMFKDDPSFIDPVRHSHNHEPPPPPEPVGGEFPMAMLGQEPPSNALDIPKVPNFIKALPTEALKSSDEADVSNQILGVVQNPQSVEESKEEGISDGMPDIEAL